MRKCCWFLFFWTHFESFLAKFVELAEDFILFPGNLFLCLFYSYSIFEKSKKSCFSVNLNFLE